LEQIKGEIRYENFPLVLSGNCANDSFCFVENVISIMLDSIWNEWERSEC